MKTRKISEYPVLTVIEYIDTQYQETLRYVKIGKNGWAPVREDSDFTHMFSIGVNDDKTVAAQIKVLAGGNFNVYKPCNHEGKIRVGSPA